MSSATLPSSDRVRQIAILVASVDAAAARQLLLHLPTAMAKQVRALASQLGPISAAEKRSILAEFQKSAGQATSAPTANADPNGRQQHTPGHETAGQQTPASSPQRTVATDAAFESDLNTPRQLSKEEQAQIEYEASAPAWTKLSTEALVRFVKVERVAVIAVVISQLAPKKAVEVLQQLPRETNHAVLKRLSHLQDIDPDATAAIDEHLSERLNDYQHRIESEHESSRRLRAVLAAAPIELQQEWAQVIEGVEDAAPKPAAVPQSVTAPSQSTQATIAELYAGAVLTTADTLSPSSVPLKHEASEPKPHLDMTSEAPAQHEPADVLPFPAPPENERGRDIDRTFLQDEFEQILRLSQQDLATLLTNVDSPTVMLALAGSTPEFMRRFTRMLDPTDAKALTQRIAAIGPINLRDVDEAQRRIIDRAANMHPAASPIQRAA